MSDITNQKILINAQDISKDFQIGGRDTSVIRHTSFAIADGSFTIIHGPSGSGKTTLLNILTGLDEPTSGRVYYQGENIYDLSESGLAHFRARTMGIVYQTSYWVKSLNVIDNVALPLYFLGYNKANAEREALESLRRVGIEQYAKSSPTLLSGGEQQRVSMARALVSNPDYIVADEPTGNLDSENGANIMQLLDYFHKTLNRTIILVTHNQEYLKYATQTIHIKDGRVAEAAGVRLIDSEKAQPRTGVGSGLDRLRPIRLSMLMRMAMANLNAKKFRNNLTMLGVAIGISAIFLLLSFGLGLQNLVQKQIIGTDSVRVINVTSVNSDILRLDSQATDKISNLANVDKIGRQHTVAVDFHLGSAQADGVVYGVDQEYLALSNLTMAAGVKIQPNEVNQLMISRSLIKSLGYEKPSQVVGKEISLSLKLDDGEQDIDTPFKIVGVVESASGSAMYISQQIFKDLGNSDYKQLKVVATDDTNVTKLRQQIEAMGYQTASPLDTIDQVNRFFRFFNVVLVGFGGIGMLIAIIGMLNTLTVALLERTKEVGLMVALGARRRDMRRLFVAESLLLTTIGGVVGILFSLLLALLINLVSNNIAISRGVDESFSLFAVPFWLLLGALLFMMLIGYLVSILPARRASKIAPVDALRRE